MFRNRRSKARRAALTGLITLVTALTLTPAQAHASVHPAVVGTKDALSGVGYADRDEWGNWRGQKVQVSETWNDAKDSNGVLNWHDMDNLYTVHDYYSDGKWDGALSLAQPMYAQNENVNGCATTSEISTWANDLKAAWPRADAFIRLGWEFNGDWYTWKQNPGDAAAFKSCWIRWYTTVKGVSSGFKLIWNPNNQSSNGSLDVRNFFPGKQYVDAAGPDAYALGSNNVPISPDKLGPNGEPLGINAWVDWVAQQGVPFASPEWAIRDQSYGSTDPAFLTQMRTAFQKAASSPTGLAYESYFDGSTDFGCQFTIHDSACGYGKHQAAADRYKSLWNTPYSTSGGTPGQLPRTGWTVSADSEETSAENAPASAAIDGSSSTYWHSRYSGSAPAALPHSITIDMHATHTVSGLSYLPRPAEGIGYENGRIGAYKIELSTDGSAWRSATTGTFADNGDLKNVTFTGSTARYVRLTATTEAGNRGPWSSAAELNLSGS